MAGLPRAAEPQFYAIALGSNLGRSARLSPSVMLQAGFDALDTGPLRLLARSRVIATDPVGPSQRRYANAAAVIATMFEPVELLAHLKALERAAGRRRGRRWGARPLDLDIILWSGGRVRTRMLTIPHAAFGQRLFVLAPLAQIARDWRDPATGLRVRHLLSRARAPKPVDPGGPRH